MDIKHIIVYGNPVDGFSFIGPFDDHESAHEFAEEYKGGVEWWVLTLEEPDSYRREDGP